MRPEIKRKIEVSSQKQVSLTNMSITDPEIDEIAAFIVQTRPHIKELFLPDNLLTDEGARILANRLTNLRELTELNLQSNRIDRAGIKAICSLAATNPKMMFFLHGNKVRDVGEMEDIKEGVLAELKNTATSEIKKHASSSHAKRKRWWPFTHR